MQLWEQVSLAVLAVLVATHGGPRTRRVKGYGHRQSVKLLR